MRFLKIAILFIGVTSFAQGKVGVVDVDFILSQMPEMEEVRTKMGTYADQLDVDMNKKFAEYNTLRDSYEAEKDKLKGEDLQEKQRELMEKEQDIQKFQRNGAQLMEVQKQEYLRPLYQKIGNALNKIASQEKFTMVQELSQDIVFLDPEYNLTLPILNELGIELSEEDLENMGTPE